MSRRLARALRQGGITLDDLKTLDPTELVKAAEIDAALCRPGGTPGRFTYLKAGPFDSFPVELKNLQQGIERQWRSISTLPGAMEARARALKNDAGGGPTIQSAALQKAAQRVKQALSALDKAVGDIDVARSFLDAA